MLPNKINVLNIPIVFMCVLNYSSLGQDLNDNCEASQGVNGYCKYVQNCEQAVRSIEENRTHYFNRCGFKSAIEIVCCPIDNIPSATSVPSGSTSALFNEGGKKEQIMPMSGVIGKLPASDVIQKTDFLDIRDQSGRLLRKSEQACKMYEKNSVGALTALIIGGTAADENEFPHMAAIKFNYTKSVKTGCGGSLISRRHILTAAHCLSNGLATPVAVILGTVNDSDTTNTEVTTYGIESSVLHPLYLRRSKYHDIAIIKLDRDVIMKNPKNYIYPACLNTNSSYPDPSDQLTITGWGLTGEDEASDILMKTAVGIISTEDCKKFFIQNRGLPEGITTGHICAGGKGKDSCNGDSGGPLQSLQATRSGLYRIAGLTSFGYICGSGRPGVYTRVSHYLDWIESVVWPVELVMI